jgi:AAA family ATP:ADP antiporter
MTKNRLFRLLSRTVEIKRGEEVISLLLFSYFFLITAPYGIIKSVRDTKYLLDLSALELPFAYLSTALIMGVVVALHSKLQTSLPRGLLIISSLVFFIVTCILSGFLFFQRSTWMPIVFWVWATMFILVLMTQFWILVNDIFNPREAKRLIGFFGSGGILGGIAGGLLTGYLGRHIPDYLLFIAAGMLILNAFVVNLIFINRKQHISEKDKSLSKDQNSANKTKDVGFRDCFKAVRKNYFLTLLAAAVTLTLIVSTLVDWQYKNVFESSVKPTDYISYFGFFNAVILIIPFFVQLLMTSNIIKRYGIRWSLLVYPLALFLCTLGIAFFPILIFAFIIKGSDKSLSFSLNQSIRELLYIPISPEIKYKAKIFIDIFVNRFAKGIGALILMVFIFLPATVRLSDRIAIVSTISIVFILAWIVLNVRLSKEYTNIVKQKMPQQWESPDKIIDAKLDVGFMKQVLDTLEDKERSSVLYAMDVFDLIKQDKLTPDVKKLIGYKQDEMRVISMGMLFEGSETGISPEISEELDEDVLFKEIKEVMALDVYQEVMKDYIEKVLDTKEEEAEIGRMEIAKVLGFMDTQSPIVEKLGDFIQDESLEVSRYAMESAAKLKKREYVPTLIEKLGDPLARVDARIALEKYGPKITGTLADYLGDLNESLELRKEVVAVLSGICNQEAADYLIWEMAETRGDMDTEIIDALNRIRAERDDIDFPKNVVKKEISAKVKEYCKDLISFYKQLKTKALDERKDHDMPNNMSMLLMNIFKLLGLIYSHDDIMKSYQNIRTNTKDSVAYAVELLDNLLQKEIKEAIFSIIENIAIKERVERCQILLKNFPFF